MEVRAKKPGSYELYRIANDAPLQLVSEQIGKLNRRLRLAVGSYLVFADCSSEQVVIKSGRVTTLIADQVRFIPPKKLKPGPGSFLIQCTRHEKTQTRQRLVNQFKLNILRGQWEMLIGMTSLQLKVPAKVIDAPLSYRHRLSALRVETFDDATAGTRYFVSPHNSLVSLTESQNLGDWLFLLPGSYNVELNGSTTRVELEKSKQRSLKPSFIKVVTPPETNLSLAQAIQGNPLFVEINGSHWLNLNEIYPVLPGSARLRLVGSEFEHEIALESGVLQQKVARAVQVDLHCPPWDWSCLGSRKIYLSTKDGHYPFAQGISDVPLLFFEEDAWLTIEGSRDIRHQIKKDKAFSALKTARVEIVPKQELRANLITDLLRMESVGPDFVGNSLDLSMEQPTTLYLIPGVYNFTQYTMSTSKDGERRKQIRRFVVNESDFQTLEALVFLNEKKIKNLTQRLNTSLNSKRIARRRLILQKYRTPRPFAAM